MSEQLEFLQITEEASDEYEQMDIDISVAPAPANENIQVVMLKNIVLNPGWFDSN